MVHFYADDNPYIFPYVIDGIVFDNDNSLYQEPDNAQDIHKQAAVRAVQNQYPDIGEQTVREMMDESKKKYGGSLEVFEVEHGADIERLRNDHYDYLIANTSAQNGFFDTDRTPQAQLEELEDSGVRFAIATHGNRQWVHHTLEQNELDDLFIDREIVTKDDVGGLGKCVSTDIYDAVLDTMNVPYAECASERGIGYAMVEDEMVNLRLAKARGMATILINNGRYQDHEIEDYVDVVVKDNKQATQLILDSNSRRYAYDYEVEVAASHDATLD